MNQDKVNPGYFLTGSRAGNAGEGLRLLARMIARRLMEGKSGMNGEHSHPGMPSGGDEDETGLESPGRAYRKRAVPPSGCRMRLIGPLRPTSGWAIRQSRIARWIVPSGTIGMPWEPGLCPKPSSSFF